MVSPQVDQPRVKRARRNALRPNSLEIDIIREIGVTHRLGQITVGGNEATDDCDRDVETTNNIGNVSNHNNERLPLPPPPTVTTTLTTTSSLIITSAPTPVTVSSDESDDDGDDDAGKNREPIEESRG